MKNWYVDSSIILRALVNNSAAARRWIEKVAVRGDGLYGSRMLELEVRRVAKNAGKSQVDVDAYLNLFHLVTITDDLIDDAINLDPPLGGADALHVATALRLRELPEFSLVTHDGQMANGAEALGLNAFDPVTDDPNRPPVA